MRQGGSLANRVFRNWSDAKAHSCLNGIVMTLNARKRDDRESERRVSGRRGESDVQTVFVNRGRREPETTRKVSGANSDEWLTR